jgi:3-keto-5-aminohexanoate cleavage enzyme
MMSICFNAHDERFQPDEKIPAVEIYAVHDRGELEAYCKLCLEYNIKPEIEVFHTGAFWNIGYMRKLGLLKDPCWLTLFLGWPGGCWTPPTPRALTYLVEHLPPRCNYSVSVMDIATQLKVLTTSIILGGHVRIGIEDNPYINEGVLAKSNAELVEKIVRIARELGRDIATPEEARKIIGLPGKKVK